MKESLLESTLSSPTASPETDTGSKPVGIILFGLFSILAGAALTIATLILAVVTDLTRESPLWPLVALVGAVYVICGIGSIQLRSWAWKLSVLIYGGSLAAAVVQSYFRQFAWGIFIEPIILAYLLLPQVRAQFVKASTSSLGMMQPETGRPPVLSIARIPAGNWIKINRRWTTIINALAIIAILSVVPIVILFVHGVFVSEVIADIAYAGNPSFPWFGFSPKAVSGVMFAWGNGRLGVRFSLTNLGLFQTHSINSISVETAGFVLSAPSMPISIPDGALVTLSIQLQTPDYNYYGPVMIQINTS